MLLSKWELVFSLQFFVEISSRAGRGLYGFLGLIAMFAQDGKVLESDSYHFKIYGRGLPDIPRGY